MGSFGVEEMLHPLSSSSFLDEHWERKPLHVPRQDPSYYRDLFSAGDLDALLAQSRPRFPQIRAVAKDRPFPAEDLLDGGWLRPGDDAQVASLYTLYSSGFTVVIELQKLWRPISRLCRDLDERFHHQASAELYLTPKDAQGFDLHCDQHDVFVLQIEGAKRWTVYQPTERFPTEAGLIDARSLKETPVIDATVEAGDLLYIPAGFPHQGATSERFSLHLTFGVLVHRWHHLLAEALLEVAARDERFRESLPNGFLDVHPSAMEPHLRELFRELSEGCDASAALARLSEAYLARLEPLPDGHFSQLHDLADLELDSLLEKRAGSLCSVSVASDSATIHFPGGSVTGPSWVEPVLRFIRDQRQSFSIASLPDTLDTQGKLVLARRLIREGLLRRATT